MLKNDSWNELVDILEEAWPDEVYQCTELGGTDMSLLNKVGNIAIIGEPENIRTDEMVVT